MSVRAKFRVDAIEHTRQWHEGETKTVGTVKMAPVYGDGAPENKEFFKWTPFGKIELGTLNPNALAAFEIGKEYYVDFTQAP